jgi:hypothetical protein
MKTRILLAVLAVSSQACMIRVPGLNLGALGASSSSAGGSSSSAPLSARPNSIWATSSA